MGTPFEDFVNENLGVRMPLFIDTTTPALSSKAAGSLGSKFVDSSTNFLYEKTGYTNADWVKIADLGESRGGGGGGGMSYSNFTGGWNIEISGDSNLMFIETSKSLSGSGYFFDASGVIGTGDGMPFVVSESGQVGLNIYTGENQATGYVTPYHLHVSGVTALSGSADLEFASKPALTVIGDTELDEGAFYVSPLTTAERNALSLRRDGSGALVFNTDSHELQVNDGNTWRTLTGGALGDGVAVVSNIGAGSGIASGVVNDTAYFKSLIGGTNLQITGDDESLYLNVTGISGGSGSGVTSFSNLGAGSGIASGVDGTTGYFKTLVGGTNLQITGDDESLYLNVTGISGGSGSGITSFTNLGAGSGIASGVDGTTGYFKTLVGGTNLQITGDDESLYLNVTGVSGSTVSGITGASNIGAGSGVFSGISDNELVFRTIEAGPNVSITESFSGLKISASTTNVTVTGGTVSGGLGSNPYVTGQSNFYSSLPDQIVLTNASDNNSPSAFSLYYVSSTLIYYQSPSIGTQPFIIFDNNASATFDSYLNTSAATFGAGQSISGYVASGRGVYLGGGSGSSSSTSGITGASNLGAGSAIVSGISSNDLKVKSLVGGTNVTLSSDDSTITINAAGGGGGSGISVKQSSYVGDGASTGIYIDVGFTPSEVFIQCEDSPYYGQGWFFKSNSGQDTTYYYKGGGNALTVGGPVDYGTVTGNGFVAKGHLNNSTFNHLGSTYNYIATSEGTGSAGGGSTTSGECSRAIIHLQSDIEEDFTTGIYDKSIQNNTVTINGVTNSTTQVHRGNSSIYFDGSNSNYLLIPTDYPIYESTNATIESWVYWDPAVGGGSNDDMIIGRATSNPLSDGDYIINLSEDDDTVAIAFGGNKGYSFDIPSIGLPSGEWFHFAFCNNGGAKTLYINGSGNSFPSNSAGGNWGTAGNVYIGHHQAGGDRYSFRGYFQDFRVTRGECVYTGDFTPSTALLPISCGGSSSSSSSTTGITGASNIGSGSGVFSGISDNDLVFRTIEAGPNVSITESSSGLKISASTTSVTVTGGSVSGGAGSNPFVTGASNFYTKLPDSLIFTHGASGPIVFDLNYIDPSYIYYIDHTMSTERRFRVNNNLEGSGPTWQGGAGFTPTDTLSGLIALGRGVYLGGGSDSSSSTSGITGAYNLGSGSGIFSGISDNDLVFRTIEAGPNVSITESSSGLKITASTTNVTVTGGSVSGGAGSNPFVTGASNFYTLIPDEILLENPSSSAPAIAYSFSAITSTSVQYTRVDVTSNGNTLILDNDSIGTFNSKSVASHGPALSLSGYIASGRAVYLGAGSQSGIKLKDTTTAQRNARGTLSYNEIIYNSTAEELQFYRSSHDAWVKIETGAAGS